MLNAMVSPSPFMKTHAIPLPLNDANGLILSNDEKRSLLLKQRCDGMCKISDLGERRDAYEGFIFCVEMNPSSIQTASPNISDTMTSILFAIVAWHIPLGNMSPDLLHGKYNFQPFPQPYIELAQQIGAFLHKLKEMLGHEVWAGVKRQLPVNVATLLRNQYRLE